MPSNKQPTTKLAHTPPVRRSYSMKEAAFLLGGVSERHVWTLVRLGKLRPLRLLGRTLIPADEIERLHAAG
jgi:hypothetical protein